MKKVFLIITIASLFISCNINPSKETRIQKLETEIQMTTNKLHELEGKIQTLKVTNEQFETRLSELERNDI